MLTAGIEWSADTFAGYRGLIELAGTIFIYGCYIGHSPVRLFVMGDEGYEREATAEEIDHLLALLGEMAWPAGAQQGRERSA